MKFSQMFLDAAEQKDMSVLRNFIAEGIQLDPLFELNTCEECMAYLKENGIDITEQYNIVDGEQPTPADRTAWKKELFHEKVEYLRMNFAYEERIPEIKEIGKEVYGKESVSKPIIRNQSKGRNVSPFAIAGIAAAIIAVISLILWLLKK